MGLLDKIKEAADAVSESVDGLKDLATEENKEKVSSLFDSLNSKLEEITGDENSTLGNIINQAKEEAAKEKENQDKIDEIYAEDESDDRTAKEKIVEVLSEEFSDYTIKYDVSPTTIGGTGRFMNYSIGVYDGDKPKLFIMLIGKTTTSHREYRWSKQEAEKNNITFLNFVEHYPNKKDYISERLHKYL